MTTGICFFNFGGSCVTRLLVALHTLRQHYKGEITVFLAKEDRFCDAIVEDIHEFDAGVLRFDLESIARRNLKCCIKPQLFKESPYDHTLMCDGDLVFRADPSELFAPLEDKGLLVTKFSTWHTDGSRMRRRIARFQEHVAADTWRIAASEDPTYGKIAAINIGVLGWSKDKIQSIPVMTRWTDLTLKTAGSHMADEHAMQVIYPRYAHHLAGPEWNESCQHPANHDFSQAKILHFHGNKESEPDRISSRYWLQAFEELARSRRVPALLEYAVWHGENIIANMRRAKLLMDPAVSFIV